MPVTNSLGITPLKRLQWGKETTPGTLVPATAILRGEHNITDDLKAVNPNENVGIFMKTTRNYIPSLGATIVLPAVQAMFEQLPYFGEMGVKALGTGVADGGGTGKIYAYPFPTTFAAGKPSINAYSLETGDDFETWFSSYGFLEAWKLTGKYDGPLTMEATLKSRAPAPNKYTAATIAFDNAHHITDSANGLAVFPIGVKLIVSGSTSNNGTYTVTASAAGSLTVTEVTVTEAAGPSDTLQQTYSAITVPAVNGMNFNQSKLFIDPVAGAWGATQKTGTFLHMEHAYTSGWKGQAVGDGRKDFTLARFTEPMHTLKVTMIHEATAAAEYQNFRNGVPRLIRVLNQGPALTTPGTYSVMTMILDVVGFWTKFSPPTPDTGMDTIVADMMCGYDLTAGSAGQLLIVNQVATLP